MIYIKNRDDLSILYKLEITVPFFLLGVLRSPSCYYKMLHNDFFSQGHEHLQHYYQGSALHTRLPICEENAKSTSRGVAPVGPRPQRGELETASSIAFGSVSVDRLRSERYSAR